jgi:hypothetical protein
MPKSYTVAEIKDLDADEIVHKFTGIVNRIFEPSFGRSTSFQNLFVEDRDGDEIKVTLKNCDELKIRDYKGKEVTFLAHQGRDDEWSGVYANNHKYEGKTTRILLVTDAAEIVKGRAARNGDDEREDRRSRSRDEERDEDRGRSRRRDDDEEDRGRDRERESDRHERGGDDDMDKAKRKIMQLGNLMHMCSGMCVDLGRAFEATFQMHMNDEFVASHIHTLFIQSAKAGLDNLMPVEPIYEVPGEDKEKEEKKKSSK